MTLASVDIRLLEGEMERFCVVCGKRVNKDAPRSLCAGHRKMAEDLDRRILKRMLADQHHHETPPLGVEVVVERDGFT